ncbi:MAG: hypothetical protein RML35_06990 [Chloroherpetonaceae bacterium]|nr:hypothetical protein [Chloroherpetonaceae bacterium]
MAVLARPALPSKWLGTFPKVEQPSLHSPDSNKPEFEFHNLLHAAYQPSRFSDHSAMLLPSDAHGVHLALM